MFLDTRASTVLVPHSYSRIKEVNHLRVRHTHIYCSLPTLQDSWINFLTLVALEHYKSATAHKCPDDSGDFSKAESSMHKNCKNVEPKVHESDELLSKTTGWKESWHRTFCGQHFAGLHAVGESKEPAQHAL
eukprot:5884001-Amphidinium_carterae.1